MTARAAMLAALSRWADTRTDAKLAARAARFAREYAADPDTPDVEAALAWRLAGALGDRVAQYAIQGQPFPSGIKAALIELASVADPASQTSARDVREVRRLLGRVER